MDAASAVEGASSLGSVATPRRVRLGMRVLGLVLAVLLLLLVCWLSLSLGSRDLAPAEVFGALLNPAGGGQAALVVWDLRVPRTVTGLLVGCALGLAGAIMQGVTRNPLADPGILGVNAGASLAVVLAIALLGVTSPGGYIWFALAGAAVAAALVYGIGALGRADASPAALAIAGTALTAGFTSIITLLLITDVDTLSSYRFWAVGSLAGRGLDGVAALLPFIGVGVVLAALSAHGLNMLALGDELGRGLGHSPALAKTLSGVAIVLLCGAATALAGPIVFVGLVVPHLVRPFTGPDYRWILAWSAVLGPVVLLAADVVGRLVVRPAELEVGLVVAAVGAPLLIALVRRSKVGSL